MPATTWTPTALASETRAWQGSGWRAVEAQHQVASMRLVGGNLPDQALLEAILDDHDYFTLVACDADHVLGFIGTRIGPLYESDGRYGQIMALAVAASHHRRGVGRVLMQAAETKLVECGARELVVTSGRHRSEAHAFYESCGYTFTGRRYRKSLGTGEPEPADE